MDDEQMLEAVGDFPYNGKSLTCLEKTVVLPLLSLMEGKESQSSHKQLFVIFNIGIAKTRLSSLSLELQPPSSLSFAGECAWFAISELQYMN